jgi:Trypsin
MHRHSLALAVLALAAASAVQAAPTRTASGTFNGIDWQAQSLIVGQTSTGTLASGGNPLYTAPMPQYNGVVSLIMTYTGVGSFICTGTLLPDRQSVLTAAHCVTDGPTLATPNATTAYFYGGPNPDTTVAFNAASTAVTASQYFVNPGYTGEVIDQNDIAIIRLSAPAPTWANSYQLSTATDLTGAGFNVAGYGRRSNTGGAVGANLGTNILRQGDNNYSFRFGDAAFGAGYWDGVFGSADVTYSYVSDFDNGLAANDATALLAADPDFNLSGPRWEFGRPAVHRQPHRLGHVLRPVLRRRLWRRRRRAQQLVRRVQRLRAGVHPHGLDQRRAGARARYLRADGPGPGRRGRGRTPPPRRLIGAPRHGERRPRAGVFHARFRSKTRQVVVPCA